LFLTLWSQVIDLNPVHCYDYRLYAYLSLDAIVSFYSIVRWVLSRQALIGLLMVTLFLVFRGSEEAVSVLLGSLIGFLPNLYLATRIGIRNPAKTSRQVLRAFYSGVAVKLLMTAVLFAVVLNVPNVRFVPLLAGFVPVVWVYWFALLVRGADWK